MAAIVVKEYLLPMFDSEGKKALTKKNGQNQNLESF